MAIWQRRLPISNLAHTKHATSIWFQQILRNSSSIRRSDLQTIAFKCWKLIPKIIFQHLVNWHGAATLHPMTGRGNQVLQHLSGFKSGGIQNQSWQWRPGRWRYSRNICQWGSTRDSSADRKNHIPVLRNILKLHMFVRRIEGKTSPLSHERPAKTSIEKCGLGSKISFLRLHFIISRYILIASPASLANCMRKASFVHLHFSVCSIFGCPAFFVSSASTVCVVWCLPTQLRITAAPFFLQLRNKFWIQFVGKSPGWTHSDMPHAIHSLASVCVANHRHSPAPLPWLSSSEIKIVKPDLQVQLCPRWAGID